MGDRRATRTLGIALAMGQALCALSCGASTPLDDPLTRLEEAPLESMVGVWTMTGTATHLSGPGEPLPLVRPVTLTMRIEDIPGRGLQLTVFEPAEVLCVVPLARTRNTAVIAEGTPCRTGSSPVFVDLVFSQASLSVQHGVLSFRGVISARMWLPGFGRDQEPRITRSELSGRR
ncbi:MAG: hypothetical protein Q8Q09_27815 [Deltaproteobacteria bacterium]|nr:hypothetical protein [Deltaproteobacteria bacterium]